MTRKIEFKAAKRENMRLLVGLSGGTGSGKTLSALRLASGLTGNHGRVAVVDTENGRALEFADAYRFDHAQLTPPFRPAAFADAVQAGAEAGYEAIIVDSATHEYAGEGGLLDWHEEEFQRLGAREAVNMAAWIKPKMEHKRMVSRLLQMPAHIILCFRAEPKVEIGKDANGKMEVRPKESPTGLDGVQPITEKNLPFELTASLLLSAERPGVPRVVKLPDVLRRVVAVDQPLGEHTGMELAKWAAGAAYQQSDEEQQVANLANRLVAVADQLGVREIVIAKVAAARRRSGRDLAGHAEWLKRQIAAAEDKLGDGEPDEEIEF